MEKNDLKSYIFSVLTRGIIAFSGFAVFIVTAKIFGAEGRGTIAFGTSLFGSIGLLLSLNLGRVFLGKTSRDESLKREFLPHFLVFNFVTCLVTAVVGVTYWLSFDSARALLDTSQILGFSFLSFFYVWYHNGHSFYSSFSKIKNQDFITFITRLAVLSFLFMFWILKVHSLTLFIWWYSVILFLGSVIEMMHLLFSNNIRLNLKFNFSLWKSIMRKSLWAHIDYCSFYSIPLIMLIISAKYFTKKEIGTINFALQIIALIYLLSTTANMRLATYISSVGYREKISQFKKLLLLTALASVLAVVIIYFALIELVNSKSFSSFSDVAKFFLISSISIPGYLSYQFMSPIWVELKQLKVSAILHLTSAIVCLVSLPFVLQEWGPIGLMSLYSVFHILILFTNVGMYFLILQRPFF